MPDLPKDIHLVHERLFIWDEGRPEHPIEDWKDNSWLYLLPLDAIRNRNDIKNHIIAPAFALVEGAGVHEVFANRPEVLRFAESEGRVHLLA